MNQQAWSLQLKAQQPSRNWTRSQQELPYHFSCPRLGHKVFFYVRFQRLNILINIAILCTNNSHLQIVIILSTDQESYNALSVLTNSPLRQLKPIVSFLFSRIFDHSVVNFGSGTRYALGSTFFPILKIGPTSPNGM